MTTAEGSGRNAKMMLWAGWALTGLSVLGGVASGVAKLTQQPEIVANVTTHFGYPASLLVPLGVTEVLCTVIYAIPRTRVLGAVLLTAYLGGAVATHVRIGEGFAAPIVVAVMAWGGLFLRDERLRALLPLSSAPKA